MDGLYIMVDGHRYKRMVDKRKKYKYPSTDASRLQRKLYMRQYRSAKRKNEVALLLADFELAGEAAPPRYDSSAQQNLSIATLQQPDSVRTSGPDCPDGHRDTSGWQQNVPSLD